MTFTILLRLLFAHLAGDFFFQPDKLCNGKCKESRHRYAYLLLHSAVQAVLAYLFVADWTCWSLPAIIFVSHFLIDFGKTQWGKNDVLTFVTDQMCHLIVITGLWYLMFVSKSADFSNIIFCQFLEDSRFWTVLIAYAVVIQPASIFLSLFVRKWTPTDIQDKSLPKAGKWIGYMERILILTFIFAGCIEGVGFLLAAKSIFRFGELNKPSEIKTTEYVLIGTFASFAIALLTGFITKSMIGL